jgi:hypothetical protein
MYVFYFHSRNILLMSNFIYINADNNNFDNKSVANY